ncbi:hypothetical protein [Clostridium pasteurianum]|uniref:Phage-related protein n=1 Tax=Clostridium pasteurianum BC1 TaxID=86416 RepID=R4KA39_CLOPA|nr:hypothetical protein [Clostridium pasteurianum]AGK97414.1 phage-related protein [Clostridium pasteurianum BC1]
MIPEIIYNGIGSYSEFGAILNYFHPQPPTPKAIEDSVPGMNSTYDFSNLLSGGEPTFDDRKIQCSLEFVGRTKKELYSLYGRLLTWLMLGTRHPLIYSEDSELHYNAKVSSQTIPTFEVFCALGGTLVIEFLASPYRVGNTLYGNLLWDDIDFDLPDYIQDTQFDVVGSKTVTIYIPGSNHSIVPKVVTDSSMTCALNSYTATFNPSTSIDWGFKLKPGANTIIITGTGSIDFQFQKEVL